MAIYKLKDITNIKRGSSPRPINDWLTKNIELPWAKISDLSGNEISKTKQFVKKEWLAKGLIGNYNDLFLTNSASPGIPFLQASKEPTAYHDGFLKIDVGEKIDKKYLLYKLIVDKEKLVGYGNGSTFINLSSEIVGNHEIEIPSINEQQKIIDIIEQNESLFLKYSNTVRIDSVENCKSDFKKLIDIIEPFENLIELIKIMEKHYQSFIRKLISSSKETEILFNFEKGSLPSSVKGNVPFLNVSSANGKINRYVKNEANIFPGDVTLSLDGNCGLVNNALEGFNGYLYKVTAENIDSWQVYYSLLTPESQNIIKINETGTTIKHSANSKKQLRVREFENIEILKWMFEMEIKIKLLKSKVEEQKNKIIKLLIK